MSKSLRILLVVLGVVILLVGSVHAWFYLGGWVWPPSPEKLAEQALNGATVVERAEAAILLADCGYKAVEQLRRVLRESDTPEVRAACINGLGVVRDYESMDLFVELLEDESLVVRSSAGSVVPGMITGHVPKFTYLADDPVETRQKAIESLRQAWEELRDSPLLNRYKRLLQEMRSR